MDMSYMRWTFVQWRGCRDPSQNKSGRRWIGHNRQSDPPTQKLSQTHTHRVYSSESRGLSGMMRRVSRSVLRGGGYGNICLSTRRGKVWRHSNLTRQGRGERRLSNLTRPLKLIDLEKNWSDDLDPDQIGERVEVKWMRSLCEKRWELKVGKKKLSHVERSAQRSNNKIINNSDYIKSELRSNPKFFILAYDNDYH